MGVIPLSKWGGWRCPSVLGQMTATPMSSAQIQNVALTPMARLSGFVPAFLERSGERCTAPTTPPASNPTPTIVGRAAASLHDLPANLLDHGDDGPNRSLWLV